MQGCLFSGNRDLPEFRRHFPGTSPGDLPVAGKSICRHMMDLCGKLHLDEVLLADRYFNPELAGHLGDGSYWSLRLRYINCEPRTTLRELMELRENFGKAEDEVLIFWGMALPEIDREEELLEDLRETDPDRAEPEPGVYLFRGGRYYACGCPMLRSYSLKSYFDMNFRLLEHPGVYSLPGYSLEAGFGIGRNVAMRSGCDAQPPLIILDDVYLNYGVTLTNGAIIGQYVAIDENTVIDHSIVMNNTYIGRNMCLRNKIVNGSRVFDPGSDTYIDLDDDFLAADFSTPEIGELRTPLEKILAFVLGIVELPLYLLTLLGWGLFKNMPFPRFLRKIYPKYWKVVIGRAQLVRYGSRQQDYVFRFADTWWPADKSKYEANMADVYYYHHRRLGLTLSAVFTSQIKRMLSLHDPFPDEPDREGGAPKP